MRTLLWIQGLYYGVTAAWPIISIETFQRVTGRKTDHLATGREGDHWLVMTVSVLILSIAATLLSGAIWNRRSWGLGLLAVTAATGLTAIDVIYVSRKTISPIYLMDAAAEILLLGGWCWIGLKDWGMHRPGRI